jgi:IPT/TIG domain
MQAKTSNVPEALCLPTVLAVLVVIFLLTRFANAFDHVSIEIPPRIDTVTTNHSPRLSATIHGPTTGTVVWNISDPEGAISASGFYTASTAGRKKTKVKVIAGLSTDDNVHFSQKIEAVGLPVITSTTPSSLPMGENNIILVNGANFVPDTTIYVNASAQKTEYLSSTMLAVTMSAEPGIASPLTVVAENPVSGGSSTAYSLPLSAPTETFAKVSTTPLRSIPPNFLGLSHEWGDGEWTMGDDQRGRNYIYRHLLANLMDSPNSPFLIRMGGGSTDQYTTPNSVEEFNELSQDLPGIKFTTGVILGSSLTSTPVAAEQIALSYVNNMTPGILDSIEIGNETDNYQYQSTLSYTFDVFNGKYSDWTAGIQQTVGSSSLKFTGPTWALMRTLLSDNYWSNFVAEPPGYLQLFIASQGHDTKTISQHFYSGTQGGLPASYLLGTSALQYTNPGNPVPMWAPGIMGWAASQAHQNNDTFRVNEMNSVTGGGQPGTSDSFAAALWSIDIMFEFAAAGVDGVNFHGSNGGLRVVTPGQTCKVQGITYQAPCNPTPIYAPFSFNIQHNPTTGYPLIYTLDSVNPLYYGMYFFHLATQNNSELLPVQLQSPAHLKLWATRASDGTVRIAVVNKDTSFSGDVPISLPGYGRAETLLLTDSHGYTGTISYADNSTVIGTTGITIGGQTFDGSTDGTIQGTQTTGEIYPSNDVYTVSVQPASAVLLTIVPQ